MKPHKVFINNENQGEIFCPGCERRKIINVSNYKTLKKPIRVKCHCGHTFGVLLEYRKYQRKEVHIPGEIYYASSNKEIGAVTITSLSVTGVGFETQFAHAIQLGDVLALQFQLDDGSEATVCQDIIVRRISGNFVGAEFGNQDEYSYELDFYMMSSEIVT